MPNELPSQNDPIIFLDVETVPAEAGDPLWEKIADQSPLPQDEDFEEYFEKKRRETALFPALGRVWMIGFANKREEPTILAGDGSVESEITVLRDFLQYVESWENPWWVGHNISGFDLPFLQVRSLKHDIPLLGRGLGRLRSKPWERRVLDTHQLWPSTGADRYSRGHGITGTRRLDTVCSVLGIENQQGIMGPHVYDAYLAGDSKGVKEHLHDDVIQVREVFKKIWPLL